MNGRFDTGFRGRTWRRSTYLARHQMWNVKLRMWKVNIECGRTAKCEDELVMVVAGWLADRWGELDMSGMQYCTVIQQKLHHEYIMVCYICT